MKWNLQVLMQGDIEKEARNYRVDGKFYEPSSVAYMVWRISKKELNVTKDKRCDLEKIFPKNQREKAYVLRTYKEVLEAFE